MGTREEIRAKIHELLRQAGRSSELSDADPLFTSGLLDSLATIRLVLFLESRFGFKPPVRGGGMRELDSVEKLAAYLEERR